MITSKQILKLAEDYEDRKNIYGKDVLIFKNPTSSDIKEIKSQHFTTEVRFIADAKSRLVYVWDANLAIHAPILKALKYPEGSIGNSPYLLESLANIVGTKLELTSSQADDMFYFPSFWVNKRNPISQKLLTQLLEYNWTFADRYISNFSSYVDKFRRSCEIFLSRRKAA